MISLDRNESCVTVRESDTVRVVTWIQGGRNGQFWAIHKASGVDAYGETAQSALLSMHLKLRGFEVQDHRKKTKGGKRG